MDKPSYEQMSLDERNADWADWQKSKANGATVVQPTPFVRRFQTRR
jgi:hypothetical protein